MRSVLPVRGRRQGQPAHEGDEHPRHGDREPQAEKGAHAHKRQHERTYPAHRRRHEPDQGPATLPRPHGLQDVVDWLGVAILRLHDVRSTSTATIELEARSTLPRPRPAGPHRQQTAAGWTTSPSAGHPGPVSASVACRSPRWCARRSRTRRTTPTVVVLILDTGPIYASLDRRDADHRRCRQLIEEADEVLIIPSVVLPEVDYLVSERMGSSPMLALLRDVEACAYQIEDLLAADHRRVPELMDRCADAGRRCQRSHDGRALG